MDEIAPLLGILVVAGLVLAAVFYVCWIILATLLRIFAWVVFYWAVAFSLGAVAGLVAGFVVPFRVLSGKSESKPDIAAPEKVVAGKVIKHPPRGFTRHFGWDRAWPVYNPYQARRDAVAARDEVQLLLSATWRKVSSNVRRPTLDTSGSGVKKVGNISLSIVRTAPGIIWAIFVPVPFFGFLIGAWSSFALWLLMMFGIGGAVYVGQQIWILGYRWLDRGIMLRRRASVKCPSCYETSPRPSYRCVNPMCSVIHRDVSPGPLGVLHRRCECGSRFPTTIGAASKVLVALCPVCDEQLAAGSGVRRTIQLPAFGAVGAGKTRLFAAALTAADQQLSATSGSLEPLNGDAEAFLRASAQTISAGTATDKTIPTMRPAGRPIKLTDATGKVLELQVMDAAGESFANWHTTEELTYVNSAQAMVFVLDPLAFPRIELELAAERDRPDVLIAAGDQEDAYASVADRLRSENVKLSTRHLAVVVTKADVLRRLPSGAQLDPTSSDGVREWLMVQEQDGFIRRMESDFGDVRYFATDSLVLCDPHDPLNPLHVLQWALHSQRAPMTLTPVRAPQAEPAVPQTQEMGA
ncbi:MAG TPA: hypothetical protein VFC03_20885 [Acidimicrobiales bacterium]|nr:hypothetical protein [Acidimicrobiales bacterium]